MKYLIITMLLLIMLAGCSGEDDSLIRTPQPFGTVAATATAEATQEPSLPEVTNTPLPEPINKEEPTPTTPPPPTRESSTSERFSGLRFAGSSDGEAQTNFSLETQEIYALWEYEGMEAGDRIKRIWYLNDELYVEKSEAWDMATYGSSGTVRDVFLYDYIDGIDAGLWKVEIYLNDVQEMASTFTVQ